MTAKTDEQLMEELNGGSIQSVEELYTRYAAKLYVFFANITRVNNPEDMVHDVFVRVIENSHTFNSQKASFRTWVFRIARNHFIDIFRRKSKIKTISYDIGYFENDSDDKSKKIIDTVIDENQQIEQSFNARLVKEAVRDCIDKLENEEEKLVIVLYYLTGKVYREIGEIIGKSISMVKKH
ncbi:RNA polymerase sigma factor, partial [Candidatus Latescibacterota bacterium]